MNTLDLQKLGFNKNEAIVYLSLAEHGIADAADIIKSTKFHKNIVYDNLNKLIDKGLASYISEGNKKHFQIAPGYMLVEYFEAKQKELVEKKNHAERISTEIDKLSRSLPQKQEATILRGVRGVKTFFEESLRGGENYTFGAPPESVDIMTPTFWNNYNLKRCANKVKAYLIFNESIRSYGATQVNDFTEVRYFATDFEPLTETFIQDDVVAIMVWTKEPIVFVIQDQYVADSYLAYFKVMWKQAKK